MRVNSPESIRRARAALARYGSWDAVMKASTLNRDVKVSKTPIRLTARPTINHPQNEMTLWVEFRSDPRELGFMYISRKSGAVNRETFEARGHLLLEEVIKKGSLFKPEVVKHRLLLKATPRALALVEKAQRLWDENEEAIKAGKTEIVMYLPTNGEGSPGSRGYSDGKVAAGSANIIK